ncbi:MAG: FKBP-type peptidyl-prolyl cis-trans isomerase [Pyrinomonadaceae bacterium]|nr:FKBP-type peptidyl-prolyl cis-trans isomerase [Pyrinomonadaceae bacterium]
MRKRIRRRCRRVVIAPPKGAAITTPTGLTYIVTRRTQERQPQSGETVLVNYTGLLSSGVKFDSSLDRGQPFDFPLGKGRVIKGWDEGIAKLRVGEQATLIIPPQLGYGERGAGGVIPPNATLIFLVELVGIKETPKTTP